MSVTSSKINDFNAIFTVRFEPHLRHLINVATLPCETQNTDVILQQEITNKSCIKCIIALSNWIRGIRCLLIWGVIQQCMHETIRDIDDLRKRLMQTWFDFDEGIIDATIDQWHRLSETMYTYAGGEHFEHML